MADQGETPIMDGNQFSFRGFERYSTDDFFSESPPVHALKEPVKVSPRKKKFHLLQEEIHKGLAPLAVMEDSAAFVDSKAVASLNGLGGDQGASNTMTVEKWMEGLDLKSTKYRSMDHHGSLLRQETEVVSNFHNAMDALESQPRERQGSFSLPGSPRAKRRPLPRRASSNNLMTEREVVELPRQASTDNLVHRMEAALRVYADGKSGPVQSEGSSDAPTPQKELVPRTQASELVQTTGKATSLAERLMKFAPGAGNKAEAPKIDEGVAIPPPTNTSTARGPFGGLGIGRWLFTEKKNVQERDVNAFSPSSF